MESFRTLRGFTAGTETEEPNRFAYSATLRIFADTLDFEQIARTIGIEPTRVHRKGERQGPRSPPYKHDMWMLSAELPEERPLAEHIEALWALIHDHAACLRELKRVATVNVFLGYRSNVDTAGVEVPHTSLEMFVRLEIPFSLSVIIA